MTKSTATSSPVPSNPPGGNPLAGGTKPVVPLAMRPVFRSVEDRTVNGVHVPRGWTAFSWADRLLYMARVCIHPGRAAELREWARKLNE